MKNLEQKQKGWNLPLERRGLLQDAAFKESARKLLVAASKEKFEDSGATKTYDELRGNISQNMIY
ncbi:MAG: hypothetical protein PHR39_04690 [Actinomycetota bacterium]|nr:hypothetical protein [Actinomycetota bacterium]